MRVLLLAVIVLFDQVSCLRVVVTGATGRIGRLVVHRLLEEGHTVQAIVRDANKANEVLPSAAERVLLDLGSSSDEEIAISCSGADRMIWCATGFTDAGESIDVDGMRRWPQLLACEETKQLEAPRVVMLSSAGVTRPDWEDAKKERLIGASDIPIIRLNPGGILGRKVEAENELRASGVSYCVVRPTGLKFEGWPRGRPILSQGDVAVGRTNPDDLAALLVNVLHEPKASGKTFEAFTLAGYPPARELTPVLERLRPDADGPLPEAAVDATYDALQQLCAPHTPHRTHRAARTATSAFSPHRLEPVDLSMWVTLRTGYPARSRTQQSWRWAALMSRSTRDLYRHERGMHHPRHVSRRWRPV